MTNWQESSMPDEKEATGPRILVVDDSETDRTLVKGLLSSSHPKWSIEACSTAADGLNVLASQPVTAVITDLFMPEMSGEEFLIEVRQRFPSVPVILVTSQGSDEIAARSLALGAVNYVPKRKLADNLVPAIEEILRSNHESALAKHVLACLTYSRTVFQINNCLEQVRSLLHLIRERLQTLPTLEDMEVRQVADAVREALMNAYTHGSPVADNKENTPDQKPGPSVEQSLAITLELTVDEDCLRFTVTDQGNGFDVESTTATSGNGIRIMRQHMDSVEFGSGGSQVSLTKRFTQETPD